VSVSPVDLAGKADPLAVRRPGHSLLLLRHLVPSFPHSSLGSTQPHQHTLIILQYQIILVKYPTRGVTNQLVLEISHYGFMCNLSGIISRLLQSTNSPLPVVSPF